MKRTISFATLTLIGCSLAGCGQPSASTNPSVPPAANSPQHDPVAKSDTASKTETVTKPEPVATKAESASSVETLAVAASTLAPAAPTTNPVAPVKTAEQPTKAPEPSATAVTAAAVAPPAEPTTASAALKLIDLQTFPQLNARSAMEQGPTCLYYLGESTIKGADAFYQSEFKSRGWTELPNIITPSEQYYDRLYAKDGYYVRCTVSSGSKEGEIGVNISNLGNVDVRLLPIMPDAIPAAEATAVNAGHQTASSIIDVANTLSKKLLDLGWQEVREFFKPDIDVPHYRSIEFRKNAARVMLGIHKDPNKPADKTGVFYLAEFGIPFDIPTLDSRKILKLDLISKRASFGFEGDDAAMLSLFEKSSEAFGWKLKNAEQFKKGEAGSLLISTGPKMGTIARIATEKEQRTIALEHLAMPDVKPKSEEVKTENVAATPPTSNKTKAKSEADSQFDKIQSEVNKTIDSELQKALGSINGGAGGIPKANMADLQAKAANLLKDMQKEDAADEEVSNSPTKPNVNPFAVSEDKEPIAPADLSIQSSQCVIKLAKRLLHSNTCSPTTKWSMTKPPKCSCSATSHSTKTN